MAEWSKALVLGTSHFDGVGSNPTAAKNFSKLFSSFSVQEDLFHQFPVILLSTDLSHPLHQNVLLQQLTTDGFLVRAQLLPLEFVSLRNSTRWFARSSQVVSLTSFVCV